MEQKDKLRVIAGNEEKAKKKAYKMFTKDLNKDINKEEIKIEFKYKKSYLFGLIERGHYDVFVGEETKESEDDIETEETGNDGDFAIKVRDDGIFLKVIAPTGSGDAVKMGMIEEVLKEKEIEDIDYGIISEALTDDEAETEVKIAERRPELDSDGEIKVDVSEDYMEAILDYSPPLGGEAKSYQDILAKLADKGVIYGIKKEELKEVFSPDEKLESFLVAEGEKPVEGEDARLELKFDPDRKNNKVTVLDDGTVDYYNLNRIINVKEGDLLAKKHPQVQGEDGKKINGEIIPAPETNDIELPVGENVMVSEDGTLLLAEIDGQVVYNNNEISVLDVYVVNDDVDLSTGNIEFEGNIMIKGNVTDGMTVEAQGNISVQGSVYAAKLIAEGQITIKQGFAGRNQGELKAAGNINVEFIENGKVDTEASLIVENAIMHSDISADKAVKVVKNKGLIVGGNIQATELVEANIIGSSFDTSTEISAGITPEIRKEFEEVKELYQDKKEKLMNNIKNISLLQKKDKEKEGLLKRLKNDRYALASKVEEIKIKYDKLKEQLEKETEGKVIINKVIHPGVIMTIGNNTKRIEREINNRVEFYNNSTEDKIEYRIL